MFELENYFLPLASFVVATSGTPGPNNMMLTASGANYGFKRTIPHIFGINIGFASLLLSVSLGLGALFQWWPPLHMGLQWVGAGYLLYLAWKIATTRKSNTTTDVQGQPLTLLQAALFQFANPKAWVMVITATSTFTYAGEYYWSSALMIIVMYSFLGLFLQSSWTLFGSAIGLWLQGPRALKWFNLVMGGLTAASVLFIFKE